MWFSGVEQRKLTCDLITETTQETAQSILLEVEDGNTRKTRIYKAYTNAGNTCMKNMNDCNNNEKDAYIGILQTPLRQRPKIIDKRMPAHSS